jgi:hypothetical protein
MGTSQKQRQEGPAGAACEKHEYAAGWIHSRLGRHVLGTFPTEHWMTLTSFGLDLTRGITLLLPSVRQ